VACKPPRSLLPEWHKGPLRSYCRRPSEVRIESVRKVYQSIFTLRRIAWKQNGTEFLAMQLAGRTEIKAYKGGMCISTIAGRIHSK
jgi:hypothetical protein